MEATGDKNPLYVDEEFAGNSQYKGTIVSPAMTNAYFVGMPIWSVVEVWKIDRECGLHKDEEMVRLKELFF